ncbi:unnamed protein product [Acanthoscelides obtectus]|uniref:Uncharacterized protein n=1 Tax=Acanthoscelides obtectus TaxID=200917 RepID=A0A9P0P6D0_ACAOB|nr:unnamed protein product [Acanthoscelides obtectus]CAK1676808.1 hypothetical protein AOBTE_LOCUS30950 [Acanthoscelides obtectus]
MRLAHLVTCLISRQQSPAFPDSFPAVIDRLPRDTPLRLGFPRFPLAGNRDPAGSLEEPGEKFVQRESVGRHHRMKSYSAWFVLIGLTVLLQKSCFGGERCMLKNHFIVLNKFSD